MRIARRLLWCLVALAGCTTGPHDSDRQVIGQDECVTCHQSDYDLTARADLTPLCSPMRPDHPALRLDVDAWLALDVRGVSVFLTAVWRVL